jgi:hypothetical protein
MKVSGRDFGKIMYAYMDEQGGYQRRLALSRFYVRIALAFSRHGQYDPVERRIETGKTRYGIVKYFNDNKTEKYRSVNKGRTYEYIDVYIKLGLAELDEMGEVNLLIPLRKTDTPPAPVADDFDDYHR